jgi:subtilisin-like proprotein convertase family protein
MHLKKKLVLAAMLCVFPLRAQVFETYSFTPNAAIPDGNATGISFTETITTAATQITGIEVNLNITGDFNGDLYLYLQHGTGFSVLLNRPGRDSGNPFGYADSGFEITLTDSAANDIHTYRDTAPPVQGLKLFGSWKPDARQVDPSSVVTGDPRTAFLDSFQGLNPNGQWTLFAADLVNGGTSQIQSWGMQLTVVPEPRSIGLVTGACLVAWLIFRKGPSVRVTRPMMRNPNRRDFAKV